MELYFLRHGLAGQHGDPKYKDDSLRPLTDEGRDKLKRSVAGMKALGLAFDAVLSSPYLRAKQTAEIVAEGYEFKPGSILLTKNLLPPASIKVLVQEVYKSFPQSEHVLLVGHEPHLSDMICELLKARQTLSIDFKKGGLCCVTAEGLTAVLNWLLTPKQMMALAEGS